MSEQWWQSGWKAPVMTAPPRSTKCKTRNMRFWMKSGESRMIVFLTAEPSFCFEEHQVNLQGDFRNWATCLGMVKQPCALDVHKPPYSAAAFTVYDLTSYTNKKTGEEVPFTKRLLIAKEAAWQRIMRQAERRAKAGQSLRGACYTVIRSTAEMSCNTGDDFEFEEMVDLDTMFPDSEEFNYPELLAPNKDLIDYYVRLLGLDQNQAAAGQLGPGAGQVKY